MDPKQCFVDALKQHYQRIISDAHLAESRDTEGADAVRAEARSKADAKGAVELGRRARSHRERRRRAREELESLLAFAASGFPAFGPEAAAGLGALVDVGIEGDDGVEERTLFLLPVGAGTELSGPGGDGFVSVVTPASPVGRALSGSRVGDTFEVTVAGRDREWTVHDIG